MMPTTYHTLASRRIRHSLQLLGTGIGCLFFGISLTAQSLDSLLSQVWQSYPELTALDLAYDAGQLAGRQIDRLPDPEFQLGVFVLPVETRTGTQRIQLGATQKLPWPGKLAARAALADSRSRPLVEKRAARALELALTFREAYYEAGLREAERVQLRSFLPLYDLLETRVLARIENGLGSTVGAYQLALERQRLDYRIRTSAAEKLVPEARMRALLPDLPRSIDYQLPDYRLDTIAIRRAIGQLTGRHPRLRIYAEQLAIREAALAANEYALKPDLAVGLTYISVDARTDADPVGNGRDILGPRVGIKLPLDKRAYRARKEQEELGMRQIAAETATTHLQLQGQVAAALASFAPAELEVEFIQQQLATLTPALEVARAEYGEDRRPLEELLRLEERVLELRLLLVRNQYRRAILVARLANWLAVHPDQISTNE